MLYYKIDILKELTERGYGAGWMRRHKLMGESTIQKLRCGEMVSIDTINTICILLKCQPSHIIGVRITEEEKEKFKNDS